MRTNVFQLGIPLFILFSDFVWIYSIGKTRPEDAWINIVFTILLTLAFGVSTALAYSERHNRTPVAPRKLWVMALCIANVVAINLSALYFRHSPK